jgi:hypothetical protein
MIVCALAAVGLVAGDHDPLGSLPCAPFVRSQTDRPSSAPPAPAVVTPSGQSVSQTIVVVVPELSCVT